MKNKIKINRKKNIIKRDKICFKIADANYLKKITKDFSQKTLVFYPFNFFGNLININLNDCSKDILISQFSNSYYALQTRKDYYIKVFKDKNIFIRRNKDKSILMSSSKAFFSSISYSHEELIQLMRKYKYTLKYSFKNEIAYLTLFVKE